MRPNLLRRSRGKRAVLALLGIAFIAAAACAYLERGYLVDSWWIGQLRSPDGMARIEAARRLADRRCLRAVPEIVILIANDPGERTTTRFIAGSTYACGGFGAEGERPRCIQVSRFKDHYRTATPLTLALWSMGEDALPAIEKAAERIRDREGDSSGFRFVSTLVELRDRSTRMVPATE